MMDETRDVTVNNKAIHIVNAIECFFEQVVADRHRFCYA